MPVEPIHSSLLGVDLTPRVIVPSTTVQGSPIAAAAETVIATLNIANFANIAVLSGIQVQGWAAYTIGGTPTSCELRIRQTNLAGTVKADTGAMTGGHNTAGFLVSDDVNGFDAGAGVATYVLTLQVAGGSSNTTISAVFLSATVV